MRRALPDRVANPDRRPSPLPVPDDVIMPVRHRRVDPIHGFTVLRDEDLRPIRVHELASYLSQDRIDAWRREMLDLRRWMLTEHDRALRAEAIAEGTTGVRRIGPEGDVGELVEAGKLDAAVAGLRGDARLTREVYLFGREMGYVGAAREDGPGFEQLEVDW